jgi:peptide chain release factor subunit 1
VAIFCGSYTDSEGKEKKIMADIQPLRMLPHSVYKCDSRFHTELLREQLADDTRYGFIVMYVLLLKPQN